MFVNNMFRPVVGSNRFCNLRRSSNGHFRELATVSLASQLVRTFDDVCICCNANPKLDTPRSTFVFVGVSDSSDMISDSLIIPTKSASIFFDHCWRSSSLPMNSFHLPKPVTSMKLGESFELELQQNCGWHAPLLPLAIGNLSFQRDHFLLKECDNVFFRQRTTNRIDSDNNSQLGTHNKDHMVSFCSTWNDKPIELPNSTVHHTTRDEQHQPTLRHHDDSIWPSVVDRCLDPFMVLSRGSFSWPSKRNARQRNVTKNKKYSWSRSKRNCVNVYTVQCRVVVDKFEFHQ